MCMYYLKEETQCDHENDFCNALRIYSKEIKCENVCEKGNFLCNEHILNEKDIIDKYNKYLSLLNSIYKNNAFCVIPYKEYANLITFRTIIKTILNKYINEKYVTNDIIDYIYPLQLKHPNKNIFIYTHYNEIKEYKKTIPHRRCTANNSTQKHDILYFSIEKTLGKIFSNECKKLL